MNENYEVAKECNKELARCYVPFQVMNRVFGSREALKKGTLFPELYEPYVPRGKKEKEGRYYG